MGSKTTKKDPEEILRKTWDLLLDLRHFQILSEIATRKNTSISHVLRALLEKVFKKDLKLISDEDDDMDRSARKWIATQVERFRKNPQKLHNALERRQAELAILQEYFPEDLDKQDHDIVTRLRYKVGLRPPVVEKNPGKKEPPRDVKKLVKKLKGRSKVRDIGMYDVNMPDQGS